MPTAFDNQQASLVLGQVLQLQGVYPSPGDTAADALSPLLMLPVGLALRQV